MKTINTCNGLFLVWDQDQVGAVLSGGQFWDWQLLPAIDEALRLRPGTVAIDLGAAFGWFTVYLAQRFATVVAVEMHPETFRLLKQNIDSHGLTNVIAIHGAAYDSHAPLMLASDALIGWPIPANLDDTPNPCSIALVPADSEPPFVPSVILDDLIAPTADVDFIKVDVQGCDLRALKGLRQTIARCRPIICFEYEGSPSKWHGDAYPAYLAFFDALDYDVTQLSSAMDYVARPRV